MREARYFERMPDGRLRCFLCPRDCRIGDGQAGFCTVRENRAGTMVLAAWGHSTGFAVDPVEKKPLFHYLPGTPTLSFGTAGCNLGCRFCQNWDISKARLAERASVVHTAEEVVDLAVRSGCPSVSFTYNDPVIWAEWAMEVADEAHRRGLRTIFVTAGFVGAAAREEIFARMDATNVDLKGFTEDFYRKVTLSHLGPVLETLEWLARTGKTWTEVTNLMIPGLNDGPEETRALASWIRDHMGPETPLHFTAFHPDYKLLDRPRTPAATLIRAREIALGAGLVHVYTGNVLDLEGQSTFCPGCGGLAVAREGMAVVESRLDGNRCRGCGRRIAGVFEGSIRPADGRRRILGLA